MTGPTEIMSAPANSNEKIWRKHKRFTWNGNLNEDGTYADFDTSNDDSFNWGIGYNLVQTNPKWINFLTTTRYDHYSAPLEVKDVNNNYASTKMGDENSKILAVSNARYTEIYYTGGEYEKSSFDNEIFVTGRDITKAHTGKYSLKVSSNGASLVVPMRANEHRAGLYKISVWAEKSNADNARIVINYVKKDFNGEKITAGDWVQLNHYETLGTGAETIHLTSDIGDVYYDDFRLLPAASTMKSYVYNEFDELTDILGSNNLATHFTYDEAGRLCKTFTEVIDNEQIVGGLKMVSQNRYHYEGMSFYNSCSAINASITAPTSLLFINQNIEFTTSASYTDGSIASWEINYGDDNIENGIGIPPTTISHTYTSIGNFTVSLSVTSNEGEIQTASTQITIQNEVYFSDISQNINGPTTARLYGPPGATLTYSTFLGGSSSANEAVITVGNTTTNLSGVGNGQVNLIVAIPTDTGYVNVSLFAYDSSGSGNYSIVNLNVQTSSGSNILLTDKNQ